MRGRAVQTALGVRPEDVGIGPAPSGANDLGEWVLVRVDDLGPKPLWTLMRNGVRLRRWADINDVQSPRVQLHVRLGCLHRFDATTGQRIEE